MRGGCPPPPPGGEFFFFLSGTARKTPLLIDQRHGLPSFARWSGDAAAAGMEELRAIIGWWHGRAKDNMAPSLMSSRYQTFSAPELLSLAFGHWTTYGSVEHTSCAALPANYGSAAVVTWLSKQLGPHRYMLVYRRLELFGCIREPWAQGVGIAIAADVAVPMAKGLGPGKFLSKVSGGALKTDEDVTSAVWHIAAASGAGEGGLGRAVMARLRLRLVEEAKEREEYDHPFALRHIAGMIAAAHDPDVRGGLVFTEAEHICCEALEWLEGDFKLWGSKVFAAPSRAAVAFHVKYEGFKTVVWCDASTSEAVRCLPNKVHAAWISLRTAVDGMMSTGGANTEPAVASLLQAHAQVAMLQVGGVEAQLQDDDSPATLRGGMLPSQSKVIEGAYMLYKLGIRPVLVQVCADAAHSSSLHLPMPALATVVMPIVCALATVLMPTPVSGPCTCRGRCEMRKLLSVYCRLCT